MGQGDGRLAEYVLARFQAGQGQGVLMAGLAAHVYSVYVASGQEFVQIFIGPHQPIVDGKSIAPPWAVAVDTDHPRPVLSRLAAGMGLGAQRGDQKLLGYPAGSQQRPTDDPIFVCSG